MYYLSKFSNYFLYNILLSDQCVHVILSNYKIMLGVKRQMIIHFLRYLHTL